MEVQTKKSFGISLPCPKCQKPNPIEARICTCGKWFIQPEARTEVSVLPVLKLETLHDRSFSPDFSLTTVPIRTVLPTPKTKKLGKKKFLILGAFIVLVFTAVAYWGGLIPNASRSLISTESDPVSKTSVSPDGNVLSVYEPVADVPAANPATNTGDNTKAKTESASSSKTETKTTATLDENAGAAKSDSSASPTMPPAPAPSAAGDPTSDINAPPMGENRPSANKAVAIARCADGTFSYTRSGACSYRGGVAAWLNGSAPPTKANSDAKTAIKPTKNGTTYQLGPRGGCYYLNADGSKI